MLNNAEKWMEDFKMKKLLVLILTLIMAVSLVACGVDKAVNHSFY